MFDHYPWGTLPIPQPTPPPTRYVKFGDAMICTACRLDARYCRCASQPATDAGSNDRADADLAQRVRECEAGQ